MKLPFALSGGLRPPEHPPVSDIIRDSEIHDRIPKSREANVIQNFVYGVCRKLRELTKRYPLGRESVWIANRESRILGIADQIRRQIKVTFSRDVYMKTIAFRFAPRAPCLRPITGDPGQLHLKTRPCTVASGCGQLSFTSRSRGDSCRQVVPGGSAIAFRFTPREPK